MESGGSGRGQRLAIKGRAVHHLVQDLPRGFRTRGPKGELTKYWSSEPRIYI